jgi:exodeoxyribonuclease VII small subunit
MTSTTGEQPTDIAFSDAYEQLKQITERLQGTDTLPPEELLDLLRKGKGLERALREHLDDVAQQVTEIEQGQGALSFRISSSEASTPAPSAPSNPTVTADDDDIPF